MLCRDKVALITGSTGEGMGRSTAFVLTNNHADIVLNFGIYCKDAQAGENAGKAEKA